MRESPLIYVWDGDNLVDMQVVQPTATSPSPTRLEEELVRIFKDSKKRMSPVKHPIGSDGETNHETSYCYSCGTAVMDQKYCHGCGKFLLWPTKVF